MVKDTSDQAAARDTMIITYELAAIISSLVGAHGKSRQQPSNYEKLFRFLMRNEPTRADLNQRLVADFKRIRSWFMSWAHFRDTSAPGVVEDELQAQFGKFEGMSHSFVGDFFTGTSELDEILQQANE